MTLYKRITLVAFVAGLLIMLTPGGASAHTAGGASATNYQSVLDSVNPAIPGVSVSVVEQGNKMQVTNSTDTELNILGYSNEPYLRVSNNGVFVNVNSPAYYTNRSRYGNDYVPPNADANAPADWKKLSSSNLVTWHDHRIHWVAKIDPPTVRAQPDKAHAVIPAWTVPMTYGQQPFVASGHLDWVPAPSVWPWLLVAVLGFAGALACCLSKASRVLVAVCLGVLIVIDITHTTGICLNVAGTSSERWSKALSTFLMSGVAWVVGIYGAVRLWKKHDDGLWLVLFSALLIGILGGISDQQSLTRSQVPFVWAAWLDRLAVSLSVGVGAGLVVGVLIILRRQRAAVGTLEEKDQPMLGGGS